MQLAQARLHWARKRIDEFIVELDDFLAKDPYRILASVHVKARSLLASLSLATLQTLCASAPDRPFITSLLRRTDVGLMIVKPSVMGLNGKVECYLGVTVRGLSSYVGDWTGLA